LRLLIKVEKYIAVAYAASRRFWKSSKAREVARQADDVLPKPTTYMMALC
jgi:hypothetical protein